MPGDELTALDGRSGEPQGVGAREKATLDRGIY
jgi:hypothetical protein